MEPRFGRRPQSDEYAPYYRSYIDQVPEGDVTQTLERQLSETLDLLSGVDEATAETRYADGKWTLKQVVGHIIDVEWVFTHRVLWFARADSQALPGMEQDEWVSAARFETRSLAGLRLELQGLRSANVVLFRSLDEELLSRRGTASGCEFTVRSLLYIIAGHELHHRRVLIERYL